MTPGQPHPYHRMPAELGTLSDQPPDRRVVRLIHGLHCRPSTGGQLDPLAEPAAYTDAPNTWPTGSKPTLRTAANSPQVARIPTCRWTGCPLSGLRQRPTAPPSRLQARHPYGRVWRGLPARFRLGQLVSQATQDRGFCFLENAMAAWSWRWWIVSSEVVS